MFKSYSIAIYTINLSRSHENQGTIFIIVGLTAIYHVATLDIYQEMSYKLEHIPLVNRNNMKTYLLYLLLFLTGLSPYGQGSQSKNFKMKRRFLELH